MGYWSHCCSWCWCCGCWGGSSKSRRRRRRFRHGRQVKFSSGGSCRLEWKGRSSSQRGERKGREREREGGYLPEQSPTVRTCRCCAGRLPTRPRYYLLLPTKSKKKKTFPEKRQTNIEIHLPSPLHLNAYYAHSSYMLLTPTCSMWSPSRARLWLPLFSLSPSRHSPPLPLPLCLVDTSKYVHIPSR